MEHERRNPRNYSFSSGILRSKKGKSYHDMQTLLQTKMKNILCDVFNKNIKWEFLSGSGTMTTHTLSTTVPGLEDTVVGSTHKRSARRIRSPTTSSPISRGIS